MSLLEKIIFVADLTEPGRNFPDIPEIREKSLTELDLALVMCIESVIRVNREKGRKIHDNAYKIIEEMKKMKKMKKI